LRGDRSAIAAAGFDVSDALARAGVDIWLGPARNMEKYLVAASGLDETKSTGRNVLQDTAGFASTTTAPTVSPEIC
jgi:hypothetical protein